MFSIIIPTYNRANMIAETISSVQEQTYKDWECIVVDDGSTDKTKEIVCKIATQDSRIRYVYQDNSERSVARNNGIANSKGKYVCFLDSDDQFRPNYLDQLNQFVTDKEFPIGLILSDYYVWTEATMNPASTPCPDIHEPIGNWIFKHPATPSRACVHHRVFERFKFDEETLIVEDSVLWVSISTAFEVLYLNQPLINYRVHKDNSVDRSTQAAFKRYQGLKRFFASHLSDGVTPDLKRELISDVRWRIAEYYSLNRQFVQSTITALHSILTLPTHRHTKAKLFLLWQNILCILGLRSTVSI